MPFIHRLGREDGSKCVCHRKSHFSIPPPPSDYWESGDREGKRRRNALPSGVKAFRSVLGMKMGMAGVFKGSDITKN